MRMRLCCQALELHACLHAMIVPKTLSSLLVRAIVPYETHADAQARFTMHGRLPSDCKSFGELYQMLSASKFARCSFNRTRVRGFVKDAPPANDGHCGLASATESRGGCGQTFVAGHMRLAAYMSLI